MDNRAIASRLTSHAHRLEKERESLYRIRAYRRAAQTILGLDEPIEQIVARDGRKGLQQLEGIGRHLAITIEQLVQTGEFCTLTKKRRLARRLEIMPAAGVSHRQRTTGNRPRTCSQPCGESWR
jgi:DNA polymerase/3'-5' exonuclease PolX